MKDQFENIVIDGYRLSSFSRLVNNDVVFKCAVPKSMQEKIRLELKTNLRFEVEPKVASNKRNAKIKNVIAVGSGKGGVGKTSISVNIARALSRSGVKVGLLDLDLYGPNIPRIFGDHGPKESLGQHTLDPHFYDDIALISLAQVVAKSDPVLWRGPMAGKVVEQLFWSANWPELDYLILDLPPGTGDVIISAAQKIPITKALLVTTPQSIACMDAIKAKSMFDKLGVSLAGFACNMAYHICNKCGNKDYIFMGSDSDKLEDELTLPCLATLPLDTELAKFNESGTQLPDVWQTRFDSLSWLLAYDINLMKKDRSLLLPNVSVTYKEKK